MKKLYLIDYENAHWCGGQLHVCVWADSDDEALYQADYYMEEEQRGLFSDEYEEEPMEDESAYIVNSVTILDESNEHWAYFKDPSQESFYPVIN